MDDPVTDVVFVSDPDHCPDGYTVLTECPCGHDAQLWEKVHGGADRSRYLCFTKKPVDTKVESEDLVIESLYIPGAGVQYLMPGYSVISRTVEGEREPLRHKQLALKKVPRSKAKKVVADVVVARGKDDISKMFKRLEKINGVRICYRQIEYDPSKHSGKATGKSKTVEDLVMSTGAISLDNQRNRANTDFIGLSHGDRQHLSNTAKHEVRSRSGNNLPGGPGPVAKNPSSSRPFDGETNPVAKSPPLVEEVVSVKLVGSLSSAPPSSHSDTPSPHVEQHDSPTSDQPLSPHKHSVPQGAPQSSSQYPPPANAAYYGGGVSQYPPPGGAPSYPPQPAGYQPQAYPPPASSGGYSTYTGQPGGYSYPAPPTTTVGYDTNIGFSFGGNQCSTYPPAQPAQTHCTPSQYGVPPGQYPPPYPPATTAPSQSAPFPPAHQHQTGPSYGFNF